MTKKRERANWSIDGVELQPTTLNILLGLDKYNLLAWELIGTYPADTSCTAGIKGTLRVILINKTAYLSRGYEIKKREI